MVWLEIGHLAHTCARDLKLGIHFGRVNRNIFLTVAWTLILTHQTLFYGSCPLENDFACDFSVFERKKKGQNKKKIKDLEVICKF